MKGDGKKKLEDRSEGDILAMSHQAMDQKWSLFKGQLKALGDINLALIMMISMRQDIKNSDIRESNKQSIINCIEIAIFKGTYEIEFIDSVDS